MAEALWAGYGRKQKAFLTKITVYFAQKGLFHKEQSFETGLALGVRFYQSWKMNGRSLGTSGGWRGTHWFLSWAAPPFKRSSGGGQKSLTQLVEGRRWQAGWEGTDPPGEHRPGCRITGSHTR